MDRIIEGHSHHVPAEQVLELLGTDPSRGLDQFEVEDRAARFGTNQIPAPGEPGALLRLAQQFHQPLVYILVAAAVVTAVLQVWVDAAVIFGVVLVNVVVGFLQEAKALQAIAALSRSMSVKATVVRGGERLDIPAEHLVPGDLVLLQSGDKVPADIRLVQVRELQVDESALTGESVPVQKRTDALERKTPLADRRNMAYMTTLVSYGTGRGVVVGIGKGTEIGQISELITTADVLQTPLSQKIHAFSRILLAVILALAAFAFGVGLAYGQPWFDTFLAAVALAVGAIPEGLPAAVTIMLAIGVSRLAARGAIIRRLPAVETLGSTTIICSDKTGTLTQNQMTVQRILAGGALYRVTGTGYDPDGRVEAEQGADDPARNAALMACLTAGVLCNDAALRTADQGWQVHGDPTEGSLLVAGRKAGIDEHQLAEQHERLDSIPFESQRQYMATLHARESDAEPIAYLKGSPEQVLARCESGMAPSGEAIPLDARAVRRVIDDDLAPDGLRVLAFACKRFPAQTRTIDHEDVADDLIFLGLQAMMDPPRPEAIRAVRACQSAGIEVKMITGDHAVTAGAIALQLGIVTAGASSRAPRTITGRELDELTDRQLVDTAEQVSVFARVSPEHKLRVVKALQSRGHVVAMTGDGVNDAPALRQANIGIAMALGGTEVAREASDMVLTDDNFASIQAAVEEGRGVYDNLIKFIVWTLPTNGGEALALMLAILLGLSLPVLPVQILWINMISAIGLGMMLVFEPKEPDIMKRPPRDPKHSILDARLLMRVVLVSVMLCIAAFGIFEWVLLRHGSIEQARTAAVNAFMFGETFYLFNCRSLTQSMFAVGLLANRWLLVGVAGIVAMQLAFTYVPVMNVLFHAAPLTPDIWLMVLGTSAGIYLIVALEKWMWRTIDHRSAKPG